MKRSKPTRAQAARPLVLTLLAFLTSCGHPRDLPTGTPGTIVAPEQATLALDFTIISDVDPRAGVACEAVVSAALRRHGVVFGSGTRVAVEIVLLQDSTAGVRPEWLSQGQPRQGANAPLRPLGDASMTTELTARVGGYTKPFRTAGSGPTWACAAAAERLATALADALGSPSGTARAP